MKEQNWKYYYQAILGIIILCALFLFPMEKALGQFGSGLIGLPLMLLAAALLWNAWKEYFSAR